MSYSSGMSTVRQILSGLAVLFSGLAASNPLPAYTPLFATLSTTLLAINHVLSRPTKNDGPIEQILPPR